MSSIDRSTQVAELSKLCRGFRRDILTMLTKAGSGHPGGSLSAIDLIATLYQCELRHDPKNANWPDRDRFVLSKGHGVPALYAVLAQHGYFDRDLLPTLRTLGSPLQGHPVVGTAAGIEACTGSLGQGLSVAQGIALGARLDKKDYRVFCLMGDGEIQEGQVWEAAMSAAKYKIDNLIGILDYNRGQIDGPVSEVMPIEPLADKWSAFGWKTKSIDGHDYAQILDALDWAKKAEGSPKIILANTIKGKGVSFMEHEIGWHGVTPSDEQLQQALQELSE
ncbi:MAG: transketolase [Myxococcales bacterium]|nr:MAG: transketolase [Myxococcales bacterium]